MRSLSALALALVLAAAGCTFDEEPTAPEDSVVEGDFAAAEEAANREGSVVVWGPTSPDFQGPIQSAFSQAYPDIEIQFSQNTGNEALTRLKAEYGAGRYSVDVIIDGASTLTGLMQEDFLRPLEPVLDPATLDGSNWAGGEPTFIDEEQRVMVPLRYIPSVLIVNTDMVDPSEIDSWKDLAAPEWKGKIAAMDPRVPSLGANVAWQLITVLGEDVFTDIYVDQDPRLSLDDRQLAEWVARGQYPIGIGPRDDFWLPLEEQGLPLAALRPDDFAGWISGGPAQVGLLERAPHPNAAAVFANWFVSTEGQDIVSSIFQAASGRTDVSNKDMPAHTIPQDDAVYGPDEWSLEWGRGEKADAIEIVEQQLGSS